MSVRPSFHVVPRWVNIVAPVVQVLCAAGVFIAIRQLTDCSIVTAVVITLISAGVVLTVTAVWSIPLAVRLGVFRQLAFDLLIDHLHRVGPGCTCDACQDAHKAFNTQEDRMEIWQRMMKTDD